MDEESGDLNTYIPSGVEPLKEIIVFPYRFHNPVRTVILVLEPSFECWSNGIDQVCCSDPPLTEVE